MGTCAGFDPSRTILPLSGPATMPTSAGAKIPHSRQGRSRAFLMQRVAPVNVFGTAFLSSSLSSWSSGPADPPAPRPLPRLRGRPAPETPRVVFRCAAPARSHCRTRMPWCTRLTVLSICPCRALRALSLACAALGPAPVGRTIFRAMRSWHWDQPPRSPFKCWHAK